MEQKTAIEWLVKKVNTDGFYSFKNAFKNEIEQAKQIEKQQIIDAIMYALDEDGHTGDWKIKFANDYYNKLNEGYDVSNKTREGFSGEETL